MHDKRPLRMMLQNHGYGDVIKDNFRLRPFLALGKGKERKKRGQCVDLSLAATANGDDYSKTRSVALRLSNPGPAPGCTHEFDIFSVSPPAMFHSASCFGRFHDCARDMANDVFTVIHIYRL